MRTSETILSTDTDSPKNTIASTAVSAAPMPTQTPYATPTGSVLSAQRQAAHGGHEHDDEEDARPELGEAVGRLEAERPARLEHAGHDEDDPRHGDAPPSAWNDHRRLSTCAPGGSPRRPAHILVQAYQTVRVGAVNLPASVSDTFDPTRWRTVEGFEDLTDLTYHRGVARPSREQAAHGAVERDLPVVRVAFDRPEVRNAFRPHTVDELYRVLDHARTTSDVGDRAAHRQRPQPQGRRLGVLLGRRPAHPRPRRLPVRRGRDRRRRSTPRAPGACTSSRCSG